MLSAEEPGIHRPGTRTDHRQGCAEDPDDGRKSGAVRDRKRNPRPLLSLLELRRPGSINLPPVKFRQALLYVGALESRKPALRSGSRRMNKAAQFLRVAVV